MNNPLVSIVLPVYNGSRFLAESVESCLAQTYANWELIIVNDCSTDNSLEIAEGFAAKDARITVVSNPVNSKIPATLNHGFSLAKGELYTWTSHDNRFDPTFLEIFVAYFEQHPDVGFLTGAYEAIDEDGKTLYRVSLPDPQITMPLYNPIAYAFMYRASVAKQAGEYDKDFFLVEDYEYWIKLWLHTKTAKIADCLYFTRDFKGTLTQSRKKDIAKQLLRLRLHYFDVFDDKLKATPALRYQFFLSLIDNAEGKEKWKLFCKLSKLSPAFAFKYRFVHQPLSFLKKQNWYWNLKKKIM
jgi:glycosyltransferase involved in cell wall biosynthesis